MIASVENASIWGGQSAIREKQEVPRTRILFRVRQQPQKTLGLSAKSVYFAYMTSRHPNFIDACPNPSNPGEAEDGTPESELWFLPGPCEDEPDFFPPGPRAEPTETAVLAEWSKAEAGHAAKLARVAGRLGALGERLQRGPEGWRHRLALIEVAELSWSTGDRVAPDRLALWIALRISSVREEGRALARAGWAFRRLTGGFSPEHSLSEFLGRHDPRPEEAAADSFADRSESWQSLMDRARDLHSITRACMGFHLWALAGLGQTGDQLEAALTAARIAASEAQGAIFAPLSMGGAGGLRAGGEPADRMARWLDGMESGILTAQRHLDQIEAWTTRAEKLMSGLSGRTPTRLRAVLADWPLVSAPMAEELTGVSRAAVQRNLAWMEGQGLVREVTGHGRFRMWRAIS